MNITYYMKHKLYIPLYYKCLNCSLKTTEDVVEQSRPEVGNPFLPNYKPEPCGVERATPGTGS